MSSGSGLSALSLPVAACTDLLIENCGTQRAFALSLPALEEVRGTLLCKNCGKTGAANSASFPRLRSIGRQLAFYVNVSSFASLAFPELERVGDGLGVSDDASSDYAFYTMPSGCTGAFVLPKLKEVRGNMLLSTWNASTDRVAAFRFPALETVTGELFVGHASYKNRTVTALDFSALRQVGSVYVGNLSSATDFSTFAGALPSLSDATWRAYPDDYPLRCLLPLLRAGAAADRIPRGVVERQSLVRGADPRDRCDGTPSDEGDRRAENPARHARAP